jgi:hypothetical protein
MLRALLLLVGLVGILVTATPALSANAYDPFSAVDCGNTKNHASAVCNDKDKGNSDPISGKGGLLLKITDLIAFVGGAAAVLIMIVGAIRYITSNGDANNISAAKNNIVNAIIGLVVIVSARFIIGYLIGKLA